MMRPGNVSRAYLVSLIFCVGALLVCHAESDLQGAALLNAKGVEAYKQKNWEEALTHFLGAYRLAPNQSVVRRNLCNTYQAIADELMRSSKFSEAAEQLEVAISIDTENPSPLIQLGACYLRLGYIQDAIYRLEEAVELAPQNVDGRDLLGDAYYREGDLSSAIEQWSWVEQVQPTRKGLAEKLEKARREATVEQTYRQRPSAHFQFSYAPGTQGTDLARATTILERAYREIGRRLGGAYPPAPILVKVYTARDFSQATLLGEHVGAVYDGTIRLPMMDKNGVILDDAELRRRLFHEYTHVVVRHIAGDNVPWWLNEGLAEVFSDEITQEEVALLQSAFQQGKAFPLQSLEEHQLNALRVDDLQLAYVQSHATVRYLWTRFGQGSLVRFLNLLAAGTTPEDALRQIYRRSYATLDKEMAGQYR
ncbi:MAG TPA: peptidase MA family metallohydrolase [Candidatus Hydrogenedentes bacterium]|nr:peptidase MA family metallohydrolase [Candidatus Hydrogenedentota bacterium]HOL76643.1 peptidase MA family metallohydrolase [Candidatus Hydrogenedentota bacterium]HPO84476.1 peptidase MA family metallohydrolase [Candidatus Hydrogenedentota bacterium]